jgi:L-ascorbate metabolism protein UlaG (beta-lactamase superfamily)
MRRTVTLGLWILLLATGSSEATDPETEIEVTYIANEGFLIAVGDKKVLIDALFPGLAGYQAVKGALETRLESARPPFDGVDLVLATHEHADHFGAQEVARFLHASPALFISTSEVLEQLREVAPSSDLDTLTPSSDQSSSVTREGVTLTMMRLHHGRLPVENLGFLIDLNGFKVLHIGDSQAEMEDFLPFRLSEEKIDLALLPVWYLTEAKWRAVIEQQIRPGRIVVMHLAAADAPASWFGSAGSRAEQIEAIGRSFPGAWIPTEPMSSRRFPSPAADTGPPDSD